jgi:hypothetical protein
MGCASIMPATSNRAAKSLPINPPQGRAQIGILALFILSNKGST